MKELLPIGECIEVMAAAFGRLAEGRVLQPLRSLVRTEAGTGFLGLMPGFDQSSESGFWGLKEVCVFPDNPTRGLDTHLGAVLLHSGETGELLAIANASAVTAIRTAAVTGLATRLLARGESRKAVIFGTGVQACAHLDSLAVVLPLERMWIVGRTLESSQRFVEQQRGRWDFELVATDDAERAVAEADVITTVTNSREPVLDRRWVADGSHINLVGSSTRHAREADGSTMAAGVLFVDWRESTLNESGDLLSAIEEGAIAEEHIVGELGDLVVGRHRGRGSVEEITIFKSLGLAIEDLAAVEVLWGKALESGRGSWIDF